MWRNSRRWDFYANLLPHSPFSRHREYHGTGIRKNTRARAVKFSLYTGTHSSSGQIHTIHTGSSQLKFQHGWRRVPEILQLADELLVSALRWDVTFLGMVWPVANCLSPCRLPHTNEHVDSTKRTWWVM